MFRSVARAGCFLEHFNRQLTLPNQRFIFGFTFFRNQKMPSGKSAKDWVDDKIKGKRVVVFSKSWCPFCHKAKKVLKPYVGKEIPVDQYEEIEIENESDTEDIQDYLRNLTGARSVPRVFIGGKCIGGGDETAALERQGKLKPML